MSYLVLARKWRPMDFGDLVGQDHVSRTLAGAIASNRVAHAFLFTGVRGVGKTTSARILAKALNCMRPPGTTEAGVDPGPTASPCLKCAPCTEIAVGADLDVQEIDGASYNGVDEVRRLQDSLPYRPSRDRYKIVIVDEVHMLSQNAWNAFLKTLEEPPPHVKFIFATTEVHKVPVTILSRVQRFDFKLIGTQQITARLKYVLDKEGIGADEGALSIIAREAAGSMRDAMSLLDQVIAWGNAGLTEAIVSQVLGVASRSVLHELARALVGGSAARCLEIVQSLADQGFDMAHVARDLLALLRDLVVASVCSEPGTLLDTPEDERNDILQLARATSTDDLVRLHQGFSTSFDDVVRSGQPRAAFEMLLVKLARRPALLPIEELVNRLVGIERRLGAAFPHSRSTASPPAPNTPPSVDPRGHHGPRHREPGRPHSSRGGRTDDEDAGEPPSSGGRDGSIGNHSPEPSQKAPATPGSQSKGKTRHHHADDPPPRAAAPAHDPGESDGTATSSPPGAASTPSSRELPTESTRSSGASTVADWARRRPHDEAALAAYGEVITRLRQNEPQLAAVLEHAVPLEVSAERLRIAWEPSHPLATTASSPANNARLATAAALVVGQEPVIDAVFDFEPARHAETLASRAAAARDAAAREARSRACRHPLVREAIEVLGARIKDVRLND